MLFFKGNHDAFEKRKKQQEVWKCVRRIIDTSAPNFTSLGTDQRAASRSNRCVPAVLSRCECDGKIVDEPLFAVTKDFSDNGIGFVLQRPLNAEAVICGFWLDGPIFFAGMQRQEIPFGEGFWLTGVQLTEVISLCDAGPLLPHVNYMATAWSQA